MKQHMAAIVFALLAGCTSFSPDGGMDAVGSAVKDRGLKEDVRWLRNDHDASHARATIRKLLAAPLTAGAAVQVALLNNHGLQATYAELGLAESDLVQAARLRNPGFSFTRLHSGEEIEIDRTFLFDVLGLITMPVRTDLEQRRLALTRDRVAIEVLQVAADTRRAWFRSVATQEAAKYAAKVQQAAEAGAELARRMAAVGNFSKLDQAREQAFHAETTAQVARARQQALAELERLIRMMGVVGDDARFTLPDRLPDLPKSIEELADMEEQALKLRLDLQTAMKEADNVAASLGLTRATGFVNVIELGYQRNNMSGLPRQTGYEIQLSLPLFDWGTARRARAEFTYMQAVNRAADIAVRARSEVREAYGVRREAFELARHYRDEIVPLRKRISEENLLRYNGMLVSVFELLADARQQITSVNAYIGALLDYWIAEANLQMAMTGTSPGWARISSIPQAVASGDGGHR